MTHCNRPSLPQQRRLAKQAQKIDANHFFNLLTGPQLLEAVEALLPEHRERQLPTDADVIDVFRASHECRRFLSERGE